MGKVDGNVQTPEGFRFARQVRHLAEDVVDAQKGGISFDVILELHAVVAVQDARQAAGPAAQFVRDAVDVKAGGFMGALELAFRGVTVGR